MADDKNKDMKHTKSLKKTNTKVEAEKEIKLKKEIEKINISDFDFYEKIGKNDYGYHKICKNKITNKIFSMKILKKCDILQSKIIEHLQSEFNILSTIYHPFITELKGINTKDPCSLYLLFEFVQGGDLNSLLDEKKQIPLEQAKFYAASIVTVLEYLHNKNILHRNLKPENILIAQDGYIKISNFSYAKQLKNDYTYTFCGTPEYCPPEMINKTGHNKGCDYWSLGILLYEMLVGITPFVDTDPMKIYQKINKCRLIIPKYFTQDTKFLIKKLLAIDPKKRLGCLEKGIYDIISHPFFDNFDWKGLLFKTLEPPYVPNISGPTDISNFKKINDHYYDDGEMPIDKDKDPFYNWT